MNMAVNNLVGFGAGQAGPPAIVSTFQGSNAAPTIASATATWTAAAIGTAAADRYVLVKCFCRSTPSGTRTLSSLTIAGNAATILLQRTVGNTAVAICLLLVPTGTTADIIATWSGNLARGAFIVETLVNLQSTTPVATISATGVDPTGNMNISEGGCASAIANHETNTAGTTWTGVTENTDFTVGGSEVVSGGNLDYAAASAGQTITADFVETGATTNLAAVSLR